MDRSSQPSEHTSSHTIRLMLVDDHASVRDGLQSYFQYATVGIEVVGTAGTMLDAVEVCRRTQPTVILLDLQMPGEMPTSEGIASLRRVSPTTRVIVLSAYKKAAHVEAMLRLGVDGYCDKIEPAHVVEQAVREVAHGGIWYSPSIQPIIAEITRKGTPVAQLSEMQRYIVSRIAANWPYQRIAEHLSFSEQYVREQISRIYALLDASLSAHDKAALVTWAREHGLGPDDPAPRLPI